MSYIKEKNRHKEKEAMVEPMIYGRYDMFEISPIKALKYVNYGTCLQTSVEYFISGVAEDTLILLV
jgi:hypothetical protein